ncbi:MAG TPA: RodZ domain-containing protein [Terriglobales bacterium]|nr:RodZ domain-containing protein [Terriglobales bacterium]
MGGFGERMQREREMRSISLEEIAESTKIGCRMLRALEEEDFAKLPGGIFNKGFVRAYAKFLGIDEEQAVTDFQAAFLEKTQKQPTNGNSSAQYGDVVSHIEASAGTAEHESQPAQAAGFMRAAIIVICLLGVGALGWKFFGSKVATTSAPSSVEAAPTSQVVVPPPSSAAPASATPQSSIAKPEPSGVKAETGSKVEPVAVKTAPDTAKMDASKDSTNATGAAREEASAANPQVFRVEIYARERSWIKLTGDDGKVLMQGEIPASATRSFRAAKQMVLTVGNAPGVEISYNGKPLPQFPADQKTKTLTFTAEGLQR